MPVQHAVVFRLAVAAAVLGAACPRPSSAQAAGGPYTLRESVVSGAGARVAAAPFNATATVGQPAAVTAAAGRFRLVGGFHQPAALPVPVFHDGFENLAPAAPTASRPLTSQGASP